MSWRPAKECTKCTSHLNTELRATKDRLTVLVLAVGANQLGQHAAAPRARWVQGRTLAQTAWGTGSSSDVPRSQAACADVDTSLTFFSHVQQSRARTAYILGAFTSAHFDSTLTVQSQFCLGRCECVISLRQPKNKSQPTASAPNAGTIWLAQANKRDEIDVNCSFWLLLQ